jgi:thioredoxin-related protein
MKYVWMVCALLLTACASKGPLESKIMHGQHGDVDVIIFSSTDCPIANSLAPEIERIHKDIQAKGGELFLVHVWEGQTYSDTETHAADYNLTMEVIVDSRHELVDLFDATVTPEAIVIAYDEQGNSIIVYQGLINNLFDSPGNRRDDATEHYVRDAINAAFANVSVSPSYRQPTGCVIEQMQ